MNQTPPTKGATVAICTRNRGALIDATIRTILAGELLPDELIVVDQSANNETAACTAGWARIDRRVRHTPTASVGLSNARNFAMEMASGAFVAFVDDDCEVTPGWLLRIHSAFVAHPEVMLVAGSVGAPPDFDWSNGFVPTYQMHAGNGERHPGIMGASFAVRRTVYERIGRFDPVLGAGAPGIGGEDTDYLYRIYAEFGPKAVWGLHESDVIHVGGGRFGDAARSVQRDYARTWGLMFVRMLRRRNRFAWSYGRELAAIHARTIWKSRGRSGLMRLVWTIQGLWAGIRLPLTDLRPDNSIIGRAER